MNAKEDGPTLGQDTDAAAIERATAALLNAVNRSDLAGVLAVWSDDGVLMPPHHPSVRGRQELEQYFKRLFSETQFAFTFTSSRIEVCGDAAFERVGYAVTASSMAGDPKVRDVGKGLHIYRRQSSGLWKLAQDIWNSDNPAVAGA